MLGRVFGWSVLVGACALACGSEEPNVTVVVQWPASAGANDPGSDGNDDAGGASHSNDLGAAAGGDGRDVCVGLGGDLDGDNWCGVHDNCPNVANADQSDANKDAVGDACDHETCNGIDDDGDGRVDNGFPDKDDDGVADCLDRCPNEADADVDNDGLPDCIDACREDPANDEDGDGICGTVDNCRITPNPTQSDKDEDGIGDACDTEACDGIDNDGDVSFDEGLPDADQDVICDQVDECPNDPLNDADKDGLCAGEDNCAGVTNADQADADKDGLGDACDLDAEAACGASATIGSEPLPNNFLAVDMAVDPLRGLIYATVANSITLPHANQLVAIDPITRAIVWSVVVGNGPRPIALAADGSRAYVGLDAIGQVRVVDLERRSACFSFTLGSRNGSGARYAYSMGVLPGHPETLVSSNKFQGTTAYGGLMVLDNGAPRRDNVTRDSFLLIVASDDLVYGYNNQSTQYGLHEIAIDADGAHIAWVQEDLISGFINDLHYAGGLIYSQSGQVLDPSVPKLVGQLATNGPLTVDVARSEVFVVAASNRIDVYDTNAFTFKRSLAIPTLAGSAWEIARFGENGLVIRHGSGGGFAFTTVE
jgi:thrombospondin type 3 repeat protein